MIKNAKHFVVYTGAGVSTAANIPDFRGESGLLGPNGKGILGLRESELDLIMPTYTHIAILRLIQSQIAKFVVTSNHDNLHRKSGVPDSHIAELFGNVTKSSNHHLISGLH